MAAVECHKFHSSTKTLPLTFGEGLRSWQITATNSSSGHVWLMQIMASAAQLPYILSLSRSLLRLFPNITSSFSHIQGISISLHDYQRYSNSSWFLNFLLSGGSWHEGNSLVGFVVKGKETKGTALFSSSRSIGSPPGERSMNCNLYRELLILHENFYKKERKERI